MHDPHKLQLEVKNQALEKESRQSKKLVNAYRENWKRMRRTLLKETKAKQRLQNELDRRDI